MPFDAGFYLERHPGARSSALSPLVHYLRHGSREGFNPHPLFDGGYYLERNSDVSRLGLNPLVHYLRHGGREGRDPHPLFDAALYRELHPEAFGTGRNPLLHFLGLGPSNAASPHPFFDAAFYASAVSGDASPGVHPLVHYLSSDPSSSGDPHPLFNTRYYCSRNEDVVRAGMNPLAHYVRYGAREGRRPHPLFDPAFYARQVRDRQGRSPEDPLRHYLKQGSAEGARPHPLLDASLFTSRDAEVSSEEDPLVRFVRWGAVEGPPVHEGASSVVEEASSARPIEGMPRPDWLSRRVVVAAWGPSGQPALEWTGRLVSSASPARIERVDSGLPTEFPALCEAVRAVAGGSGDYLYLTRTSLRPEPGWLEPLLQAFALLPRVGAACSTVVARTGTDAGAGSAPPPAHGAARRLDCLTLDGVLIPCELFLGAGGLDFDASSREEAARRLTERLRCRGFEVWLHPHSRLVGHAVPPAADQESGARPRLLAVITDGSWGDPVTATAQPVVSALRQFAAAGWLVLVWLPRGSADDSRRGEKALEALGLEVVAASGDRFPPEFRERGSAAAVLLDRPDRTLLTRFMAVQPQARFILASGDCSPVDEETLASFDGVIAPRGARPHFNHVDLWAAAGDGRERSVDLLRGRGARVYCFGAERSSHGDGLPKLVADQRMRWGIPSTLAGVEAVVALGASVSGEAEAVRAALASGLQVFGTNGVKAAIGADDAHELWQDGAPPVADRSLVPVLESLGSRLRPLGPQGRWAHRRWPWTIGDRPLAGMLRKAGVVPGDARSAALGRIARDRRDTDADFVFMALISWHYRHQRPQHLAAALGRRRKRVIYVEPAFLPPDASRPYRLEEQPEDNVYCASLRAPGAIDVNRAPPTAEQLPALAEGLRCLLGALELRNPTLVLQAPFWLPVCWPLPGARLVYDSMDLYGAFPNVTGAVVALERELLHSAELTLFTAETLRERTSCRRSVVIRNGCDAGRFAGAKPLRLSGRPVVGYVGAIESWFDAELINRCVESRPEWDFIFAGAINGPSKRALTARPNLRLLGEIDHGDVPSLVAGFDVCVVPFLDNELTRCVNPVKVYEYLAAGKPVVATPLPELRLLGPDLVRIARSPEAFLQALAAAMAEVGDSELAAIRRGWAAGHSWDSRADALLRVLAE